MRLTNSPTLASALLVIALTIVRAQSPVGRNPDVSNKALITKSTPTINEDAFKNQSADAALHKLADDYYAWRNENYPVLSSDAGLHTSDDRLTDYSPAKIAERAQRVRSLLDRVRTMKTDTTPLLLVTNMGAGHGGASGRYDHLHEIAYDFAFVLEQLGIHA